MVAVFVAKMSLGDLESMGTGALGAQRKVSRVVNALEKLFFW